MTEHSQETKIAILEAKVDHMMGHVKELTLRVRANEKVVASVSLLGVIACTFIGAGYFAPKAEACSLPADGSPANCGPGDLVIRDIEKENPNPDYTDYYYRRNEMLRNVGWMVQEIRDWKSAQDRPSVEDMINASLMEYEEGHIQEE